MGNHYMDGFKERKDYELEEVLEGIIDRHGIDRVIGMIGGVCSGKACHLSQIWREFEEAQIWEEKASKLWNL